MFESVILIFDIFCCCRQLLDVSLISDSVSLIKSEFAENSDYQTIKTEAYGSPSSQIFYISRPSFNPTGVIKICCNGPLLRESHSFLHALEIVLFNNFLISI